MDDESSQMDNLPLHSSYNLYYFYMILPTLGTAKIQPIYGIYKSIRPLYGHHQGVRVTAQPTYSSLKMPLNMKPASFDGVRVGSRREIDEVLGVVHVPCTYPV